MCCLPACSLPGTSYHRALKARQELLAELRSILRLRKAQLELQQLLSAPPGAAWSTQQHLAACGKAQQERQQAQQQWDALVASCQPVAGSMVGAGAGTGGKAAAVLSAAAVTQQAGEQQQAVPEMADASSQKAQSSQQAGAGEAVKASPRPHRPSNSSADDTGLAAAVLMTQA